MKKLLLTSVGIGRLPKLSDKPLRELNLVYIPTAADPYDDKWFIEEDRKRLRRMEIKFQEVDVKNTNAKALRSKFSGAEATFVSGGNSFYLMEKSLESGFDKVIKELVNRGVIYIGASAGAAIAGPSLEPIQLLDEADKAPNLKSFNAFGLVDFVILPHYGKEKYRPKYEQIMKDYGNKPYRLIKLTDQQAVIVKGDQYKVVKTD